jgi:GGDEF domain-containing protein
MVRAEEAWLVIGASDTSALRGMRLDQMLEKVKDQPQLSIGYAQTGPNDYIFPEQLIQQADSEMYIAKIVAEIVFKYYSPHWSSLAHDSAVSRSKKIRIQ